MLPDRDQRIVDVVNEIERVTGDTKSRARWITLVKAYGPDCMWVKLSELKQAMATKDIRNPGAYFTRMVKGTEQEGKG